MAKILFINPPNPQFLFSRERHIPLGILYLSSSLKKQGHLTSFIDAGNDQITAVLEGGDFNLKEYYHSKIRKAMVDFRPDLVALTIHCSGRFLLAMTICQLLKEDYADTPVVIGGIHPSIFPRGILKEYQCVDFVLQGESEIGLVELVGTLRNKKNNFQQIDGLAYRAQGVVGVNKKEHFIDEVDKIPFPDYDLVNIKDYYFDTSKWFNPKGLSINLSVYLLSSRSCPNQCTYCSMFLAHGPRYRMRSAANVISEIEYLYNKFHQQYFSFVDDNFTLNRQRTIEICQGIQQKGLNIQFDTPNGLAINTLDEEVVEELVAAGMVKVCLAIESGSPKIRASVNKYILQEKIIEVFNLIKKYPKLIYNVFFIIGFPNETFETLNETYQLIKHLGLKRAIISFATPFPGTKLYEECAANNLLDLDIGPANLHNLDCFYYAHKTPFIKPYHLEKQDLIDFRLKVYQELNMAKQLEALKTQP